MDYSSSCCIFLLLFLVVNVHASVRLNKNYNNTFPLVFPMSVSGTDNVISAQESAEKVTVDSFFTCTASLQLPGKSHPIILYLFTSRRLSDFIFSSLLQLL